MQLSDVLKPKFRATDLARAVGVSPQHIYQIRRGIRRPSPEVAKKISDLTGIPLEDLLFPKSDAA